MKLLRMVTAWSTRCESSIRYYVPQATLTQCM